MPIPSKKDGEDRQQFISRCMSNPTMKEEYPKNGQRVAVCLTKACEDMGEMAAADFAYNFETFGYTEDLNEENFVIPSPEDYEDFEEETVEWDVAAERPGLWENIRRKKEREGKNYKPAKTVKEGRPTQDQLKERSLNMRRMQITRRQTSQAKMTHEELPHQKKIKRKALKRISQTAPKIQAAKLLLVKKLLRNFLKRWQITMLKVKAQKLL